MILNCEDPRSVDVALQAIAGANDTLPRAPLLDCNAESLIQRRLIERSLPDESYELALPLYTRALAFLRSDSGHKISEIKTTKARKLEIQLQNMQVETEE